MIPYAGIQDDEALFAIPLWEPLGRHFELRIFHRHLPLMLMSYLGTLKTAIYWPVLRLFGSSIWVLRLPVVLAGAVTIYFFFQLLRRSVFRRPMATAILGSFLLATDPAFVLTNTFDWGPVALEHTLLTAGCYSMVCLHESRLSRYLAGGFFLFGLALWNKALFLWALTGVTAAGLVVFWPEVRGAWTRRNLATAATAFFVGAFPFILFNLRHSGSTVTENLRFDSGFLTHKWIQFESAANGNALFGFIAEEDFAGSPKAARSPAGRIAEWIHDRLGRHRSSGFAYVFLALLFLAPFWWKSRAARFSLLFIAVAGAMMAATKDAGGSTHHVILLWPFPQLFAAVAIMAMPWRWMAGLAGMAVLSMNLLVMNQYIFQLERNGAAGNFTDALFPLAGSLASHRQKPIWVIDWGIYYTMDLAARGHLRLGYASDPLRTDEPNSTEQTQLAAFLASTDSIFVGHVPEREAFEGVNERLDRFAESAGYRKQMIEIVPDSNGRPVFEIFRFVR
jgi:hypothetical protein